MWILDIRTRKIWKLSQNNSRDQCFNETLFFIFIKSFCKVWSIMKRILKYSWNKLDGFCKEISNLLHFKTAVGGGGIRGSKKVFPTCMDGRTVGHALLSRYVEVVLNIDKLTVPEIIQSINHSINQSNLIPSTNSSNNRQLTCLRSLPLLTITIN